MTNWDGRQQPDLTDPPQLPDSLKLGTYRDGVLQAPTPESCCPPNCDEECCRLQPPREDHRSSSPSSFSVSSYGSNDSTEPLIQRQQPSRSVSRMPLPPSPPPVYGSSSFFCMFCCGGGWDQPRLHSESTLFIKQLVLGGLKGWSEECAGISHFIYGCTLNRIPHLGLALRHSMVLPFAVAVT